jgi:hypothetical protein
MASNLDYFFISSEEIFFRHKTKRKISKEREEILILKRAYG